MRLHGLVTLSLLALLSLPVISHPALSQERAAPRTLDPLDPVDPFAPFDPIEPQPAPDLIAVPQPAGPSRSATARGRNPTALEDEIKALHADLHAFHAISDEVSRSARAVEAEADQSMQRQRQELLDILTKLATQGIAARQSNPPDDRKPVLAAAPVPLPTLTPDAIAAPVVTEAAIDPFSLGKVLFRAGEYAKAEQAFRRVTATEENRLMLKYLIATCLRKRSQWQAAIDAYQELADSDKDPVLRDLARFQLDGIRWNLETEQQIEQIRKRRPNQPSLPKKPQ